VRRTPEHTHLAHAARWVSVAGFGSLAVLVSQTPDGDAGAAQRVFLLVVLGRPALLTVLTGVRAVQERLVLEGRPGGCPTAGTPAR
jgi:hypothetical protein